jgi:hypothetical protein
MCFLKMFFSVFFSFFFWRGHDKLIISRSTQKSKTRFESTSHIWFLSRENRCASPILWALINQIIMAALDDKLDCIRLVASDGVEDHIWPSDSFVDNTKWGATDNDVTMEPVISPVKELSKVEEIIVARME